jgi:hypothetical protein
MNFKLLCVLVTFSFTWCAAQTTRPTTRPSNPDQVMDDLLKPAATQSAPLPQPPTGQAIDKTSGRGALAPNAPAVAVMREGTYIIDRLGHLSRTPDGTQAQFIFSSDSKTLKDPPILILPNQKLQQMEDVVKGVNRDVAFRITGMVTEYRGRNYVLLEKVLIPNESAAQF